MTHERTECRRGFTLMETLVTIAIIAVVSALGGNLIVTFVGKAKLATETNAARNLVTGWGVYAADHGGEVVPGYETDPDLTNLKGEPLSYPINARYPWKLAHYVNGMERAIVFNGNEKLLKESQADYLVSVSPNLGINAIFVGGHYGSGSPLPPTDRALEHFGKFVVTHQSEIVDPAKLVVFASARSSEGHNGVGFYEVRPPNIRGTVWSGQPFKEDGNPSDHGFVDFRWDGRAVVAMAGGNVQVLSEEKLRDMRRWSNQAARHNDKDYTVQP